MGFKTKKSIFYHIPKTGGIFVKEAMRHSGAVYDRTRRIYRATHKFGLKREHTIPDDVKDIDKEGRFSFAFVRKPFEWYRSFWAHRNREGFVLVPKFPLDFLWDKNFETFITNVIKTYPDGFLTDIYKCYVGEDGKALDFVGRQENLREDLIKALTLAGEEFNEKRIRTIKKFNTTASEEVLNERIKQVLMEKEKWITDTFYE